MAEKWSSILGGCCVDGDDDDALVKREAAEDSFFTMLPLRGRWWVANLNEAISYMGTWSWEKVIKKVRGWLDKKPCCWYFYRNLAGHWISTWSRTSDACSAGETTTKSFAAHPIHFGFISSTANARVGEHEGKTPIRRSWKFSEWCEKFVGLIPHNFVIEGKYIATRNLGK